MSPIRVVIAALACALTLCAAPAAAQPAPSASPAASANAMPTIEERTRGFVRHDGYLPVYYDPRGGRVYLEIPRIGEEMLYVTYLPWGMGSNDIGLDRGQSGQTRLVRFERSGPKVLLVQPNLMFRSSSADPAERRGVDESFAQSVLFGFTVSAESDGRVLVDATEFALHDAHEVAARIKDAKQGEFRLDPTRSAIDAANVKAFPRNAQIEAMLTFAGTDPGPYVRDVTPTPGSITVHERQSFIELPEPGYVPRRLDPRAGYFGVQYTDDSAALGAPVVQNLLIRHRLEKRDPSAAVSEPVKPIVYYVDRAAPEPIRSALLEGARWWSQAFEAAGFRNAFRVELLPEGADPDDVRYNVIEWVHRATRGWSYGDAVADPRTGEIIQGHVTLGSLRGRQDWLIAEGLLQPYAHGDEAAADAQRMVLSRLRQLAAHELGHTLGLEHNFLASAEGRASVMDYPFPHVGLTRDGRIDLHDAYATGIGAWDKVAIAYGYTQLPPGVDERAALDRILADGRARGLVLLTDQDARPPGSAHPLAHLWDNGNDAAAELDRIMTVRRVALRQFSDRAIRTGMPLATLEDALVPVYLLHRYQAEAAAKVVGGTWYTYALRGDGQEPLRPVAPAMQRRALDAVLATLTPGALALPRSLLARIPPRPAPYEPTRELFTRATGLTFDAVAPATAAADMTFRLLLDPQRAARLAEQHAMDPAQPGLDDVLARISARVFAAQAGDGYERAVARTVQRSLAERMMDLAVDAPMADVRSSATQALRALRTRALAARGDAAERAHLRLIADDIDRTLARPWVARERRQPVAAPPGMPIGDADDDVW